MSRKSLPKSEKKVLTAISLSRENNEFLNKITHNKSKFIDELVSNYIKTYKNE